MTPSALNPFGAPECCEAARRFPTCDLFCRVIDNFGDAGVCWRLARRLLALGVGSVRLVTDHPDVLALIAPEAGSIVRVAEWNAFEREAAAPGFDPAELVIESFGCRLPEAYDEALAKKRAAAKAAGRTPPFYLNLDYLSAEDWVEESHDVVGLHPRLDLPKLWFFPGFTARTGGVVIEDGLMEAQAHFLSSERDAFLSSLGADPARRTLFVFCYPVNRVETIAEGLRLAPAPWSVLIAPGAAGDRLEGLLSQADRSRILPVRTPFLPQTEFDRLLWASEAAVIRGEDSFVRAQLAATPLLWSTYPTEDGAHRVKLDAWLGRFAPSLPEGLREDYVRASDDWLEGALDAKAFANLLVRAPELARGFRAWREGLLANGDLGANILRRALKGL